MTAATDKLLFALGNETWTDGEEREYLPKEGRIGHAHSLLTGTISFQNGSMTNEHSLWINGVE